MLYLLLAIASSALVSIFMRLSADRVKGSVSMLQMNYLMCLAIAGVYIGTGDLFPRVPELPATLLMGAVHGTLYLLAFVLLQLNIRKNGVVLPAIFMKLGLLVPMVVSVFLFGELPGVSQLAGFCIAVAAIVLINLERDCAATGFKFGLILLLLAGGGGDAMAKIFEELGSPVLSAQFLFYTFLTAFLLCLILMIWKGERPGWGEVIFGFLVGIPNYFSARFLLACLDQVPAVIAYPTYSVGTLLVVTLTGVFYFREQLSRRRQTAVGMILLALVLLNV